jgi:translation initiation factor 2B subunit (eIF-2B alpha/beta/delta family)
MSDLLDELTNDPTSGATGIYIKVLNHIVLGFLKGADLPALIREKAGDMVSLTYLANNLEAVPLFRQKDVAKELQKQIRADSYAAGIQLFKALANAGNLILCHSNSGSVLRALEHRKNRVELVYQTQSSPGDEGKESAKALKNSGFEVKLIADSRAGAAIKDGAIPVLGADCVTENYFVNKVGTAEIVNLALAAGITPIVVVGSEKTCSEEVYGNRPLSSLFERIPLDKVRLIVGSVTFKMSRDRKRLWKSLEDSEFV